MVMGLFHQIKFMAIVNLYMPIYYYLPKILKMHACIQSQFKPAIFISFFKLNNFCRLPRTWSLALVPVHQFEWITYLFYNYHAILDKFPLSTAYYPRFLNILFVVKIISASTSAHNKFQKLFLHSIVTDILVGSHVILWMAVLIWHSHLQWIIYVRKC